MHQEANAFEEEGGERAGRYPCVYDDPFSAGSDSDYEIELKPMDDDDKRDLSNHDDMASDDGTLSLEGSLSANNRTLKLASGGFSDSMKDGFLNLTDDDLKSIQTNEFYLTTDEKEEGETCRRHDEGDDDDTADKEHQQDLDLSINRKNPRRRLSMIMRGQVQEEEALSEKAASSINHISSAAAARKEKEIDDLAKKREWMKISNTTHGIASYKKSKCRLNFYLASNLASCYWMDKRRGFKEIFRCHLQELDHIDSLMANDGTKKFYPQFDSDSTNLQMCSQYQQEQTTDSHDMPFVYDYAVGLSVEYPPTGYHHAVEQQALRSHDLAEFGPVFGYVVKDPAWTDQYAHAVGTSPLSYSPSIHDDYSTIRQPSRIPCRNGAMCKRPNCWFQHATDPNEVAQL